MSKKLTQEQLQFRFDDVFKYAVKHGRARLAIKSETQANQWAVWLQQFVDTIFNDMASSDFHRLSAGVARVYTEAQSGSHFFLVLEIAPKETQRDRSQIS